MKPKFLWFRLTIVLGLGLGLLLLVQTLLTYRHYTGVLIREEVQRESDRKVQSIGRAARLTGTRDASTLTPVLQELVREASTEIAWIRIFNMQGRILSESEKVNWPVPFGGGRGRGDRERRTDDRQPEGRGPDDRRPEERMTPSGPVLITINQLRLGPPPFARSPSSPGGRADSPPAPGQRPSPEFVEIAIYLNGVSANFRALRGYLIVSCSAAFALMGAVIVIGLRFPHYMRGRRVEEELSLARRVQLDLFPAEDSLGVNLPFAAKCVPAWQVGGDLYDVFDTDDGEVALLLGDVSGKGLPAALLMGVVQGAVRASSGSGVAANHEQAAERLNQLMCMKTARERFVSLFWCYFDRQTSVLRYINAGHLPPLLIRDAGGNGAPTIIRLDEGGPVMGLLPGARYTQVQVQVHPGDLLVVYSDGILEAENARGEEFGEEGIIASIGKRLSTAPGEICAAVLEDVRVFLGTASPQDDQTLLIARLDRVMPRVTTGITTELIEAPLVHSRAVPG